MPDASVIILTKNEAGTIKETLESVLAQDIQYDYEVIVIDSGSKDSTVDEVKRYPVSLYQIPACEFGHGKTRNLGVSLAKGKYVVFLNGDALPRNKYWLSSLVDNFTKYKNIAAAYSRIYPRKGCNPLSRREILCDRYLFTERVKQINSDLLYRQSSAEDKRRLISFHTISCAVEKDFLLSHPFADVNFGEDLIWAKKMLEEGFKIIFEERSEVTHSHDFSFRQTLKKHFDDTRLNQKLLKRWGYQNVFKVIAVLCYKSLKDMDFIIKLKECISYKAKWLIRIPAIRIAEFLGILLGMAHYLPVRIANSLSLVEEIKRE